MSKVKRVEKQIWDLEEFDVIFRHPDGRNVRGDLEGVPSYTYYARKAKHSMSVADWRAQRFKAHYPQFEVDVLKGDGTPADGRMHIGTVRDSYFEAGEITPDSELEGDD